MDVEKNPKLQGLQAPLDPGTAWGLGGEGRITMRLHPRFSKLSRRLAGSHISAGRRDTGSLAVGRRVSLAASAPCKPPKLRSVGAWEGWAPVLPCYGENREQMGAAVTLQPGRVPVRISDSERRLPVGAWVPRLFDSCFTAEQPNFRDEGRRV